MDKRFGVWIKMFDGWKLVGYMGQDAAIRAHNEYRSEGIPCRVHPRHNVTEQDLIEG